MDGDTSVVMAWNVTWLRHTESKSKSKSRDSTVWLQEEEEEEIDDDDDDETSNGTTTTTTTSENTLHENKSLYIMFLSTRIITACINV